MKTTKKVKLKQGPGFKKTVKPLDNTPYEESFEEKINTWLGDPMEKARVIASENNEEDDPVDNLRHAAAGMVTSTAIKEKMRPFQAPIPNLADAITRNVIGFLGSNALGVAHEIANPNMKQMGSDKEEFTKATIREGAEDAFNNFVGATVSSLPFSREGKVEALEKLSFNNLLPDGYGKVENKKGNMYFTKQEQPEQRIMPGDNVEGFNKGGKVKATKKSKLKVRKGYVDGGDIDPATLPQDVYSDYLKAATESERKAIVANYKASQSPAPIINTAQSVVNNVAPVIPSRATGVGTPNVTPQGGKKSGPSFAESNSYAGLAATGLSFIPVDESQKIDHTTTTSQIAETAADAVGVGGFVDLGGGVADLTEDITKNGSELDKFMGDLNAGVQDPWGHGWKKTIDGYGKDSVGTSIGKTALDLFMPGISNTISGAEDRDKIAAAEKAKYANTVDNKKLQNDVNYVSRSGDRRSNGRNVDTGDSTASMATGGSVQKSGVIKGKGTGTSDDVPMDAEAGAFVVTAKNKNRFIKEVYRPYFGKPPIAKKTGGNVPIDASNGEFMVDADKAKFLRAKGVDLDSYADADNDSDAGNDTDNDGMKNGGKVRQGYDGGGEVETMIQNAKAYFQNNNSYQESNPVWKELESAKNKQDVADIFANYYKKLGAYNPQSSFYSKTLGVMPTGETTVLPINTVPDKGPNANQMLGDALLNDAKKVEAQASVAGKRAIAVDKATMEVEQKAIEEENNAAVLAAMAKGPMDSTTTPGAKPIKPVGTPIVEPEKSKDGTLTYALAGLQGALGIANAISNKQPDMKDTSAFEHRMQKAMANNTGLSEEEKKKFTDGATRAASTLARYGAGITGNSSEAFGMAKTALGGLSDKMLDMNVADQQLKRENINRGDRAANSLLDLDKFKFNIENERYQQNAATSAQMIDSSISNVIGNEQYLAALDRYDKRQSTWR